MKNHCQVVLLLAMAVWKIHLGKASFCSYTMTYIYVYIHIYKLEKEEVLRIVLEIGNIMLITILIVTPRE